jgi:hypothetical protein
LIWQTIHLPEIDLPAVLPPEKVAAAVDIEIGAGGRVQDRKTAGRGDPVQKVTDQRSVARY